MVLFHSQTQRHVINGVISPPDFVSCDNTYYIAHICIFLLTGVGILMAILSFYFTWYTVVVLMWTFYYIVNSFFALVPWTTCDGWWNTLFCKGNTNWTFVALFTHIWGSGWGGVWYSLFIKHVAHLFISLEFWVIHYNKTNYSLKVRKVAKKSDYSLFIIFFFNSLKK